jgi:hypothetical protein
MEAEYAQKILDEHFGINFVGEPPGKIILSMAVVDFIPLELQIYPWTLERTNPTMILTFLAVLPHK